MRRAGFVLVGGRSARMGRAKALLPFENATLAESVAGKVAEAAGSAVLIGDPALYGHLPYPVYPDLTPGRGPLSGLQAVLRLNLAEWNLIAACDLPKITVVLMRTLLRLADEGPPELDCVVPVTPTGRLQPLCAVYRQSCLPAVERALAQERFKLMDLVSGINVLRYLQLDAGVFENINTPDDWAAVRSA